jgi:hypothetical protein
MRNVRLLAEQADTGSGDLYQFMTYLLVVLISAVVMTVWLKSKGRRKRK